MSFFGGDVFVTVAVVVAVGTVRAKLLRPLESATDCGGELIDGQLGVVLSILKEIRTPEVDSICSIAMTGTWLSLMTR